MHAFVFIYFIVLLDSYTMVPKIRTMFGKCGKKNPDAVCVNCEGNRCICATLLPLLLFSSYFLLDSDSE